MSNFKHKEARQPTLYFRPPAVKKPLGLYIHIPFCLKKCSYCDFYSVCETGKMDRYIDALAEQCKAYASNDRYTVDSIYLGGGTPSLLTKKQLTKLFAALRSNFEISPEAEITCEVNPVTASKKVLKSLRTVGVNRLSIGAQSASDDALGTLGRMHTYADTVSTVETAKKLKFQNISLDCMYALPGQSKEDFFDTLQKFVSLDVDHISLYALKIEKHTPFFEMKESLNLPDEDSEIDMYFGAIDYLKQHGFEQYEISNFAKEGKKCRHNLKYWRCEEYLGLGAAAASHYGNCRFTIISDVDRYCDFMLSGGGDEITSEEYDCPMSECVGDYVMLGLRLNEGIVLENFNRRFRGRDFEKLFGEKMAPFVQKGLVEKDQRGYHLNRRGFYVSNYILSSILDFDMEETK